MVDIQNHLSQLPSKLGYVFSSSFLILKHKTVPLSLPASDKNLQLIEKVPIKSCFIIICPLHVYIFDGFKKAHNYDLVATNHDAFTIKSKN